MHTQLAVNVLKVWVGAIVMCSIKKLYDFVLDVLCIAGVCALCGKHVLDIEFYQQSNM